MEQTTSVYNGVDIENMREEANASTIQYDFPIHREPEYSGAPRLKYSGHVDLILSNLPKVGK